MLKKIKWLILYLVFFIFTFFVIATSVGASYYLTEFLNAKIEAHWWIAIMQYGDLNSLEYFLYNYQQKFFFALYLISVFIFSVIVYTTDRKGFWIFILSLIVFIFTCLIGEMAIVKNLDSLKINTQEQLSEVKFSVFINETIWFIRWYLCFALYNFLILTIGYFRKKDYLKEKQSKVNN